MSVKIIIYLDRQIQITKSIKCSYILRCTTTCGECHAIFIIFVLLFSMPVHYLAFICFPHTQKKHLTPDPVRQYLFCLVTEQLVSKVV